MAEVKYYATMYLISPSENAQWIMPSVKGLLPPPQTKGMYNFFFNFFFAGF